MPIVGEKNLHGTFEFGSHAEGRSENFAPRTPTLSLMGDGGNQRFNE